MFGGFGTNTGFPSPQIAGGICLTKTSCLGQIIIPHISLDFPVAHSGFSLCVFWYREECQREGTSGISDSPANTSSAQGNQVVPGNPFLFRNLRNPVCGTSASGGGPDEGCIYLSSEEQGALGSVRPGPCVAEQGVSHRLRGKV